MATLRFKMRPGHDVRVPGSPAEGIPQLVGQTFDLETKKHVPSEQPFECEEGTMVAARLKKLVLRDDALICADEDTAHACGVLSEDERKAVADQAAAAQAKAEADAAAQPDSTPPGPTGRASKRQATTETQASAGADK